VDLSDYQLLVETAERRVYGKLGAAYGLELSASLTVTAP
jgi:hypothetical protein